MVVMKDQRRYISYLMRLWESSGKGEPVWRASLEDPRTGERKGFACLVDLFAFLEGEIGEASGHGDGDPSDV